MPWVGIERGGHPVQFLIAPFFYFVNKEYIVIFKNFPFVLIAFQFVLLRAPLAADNVKKLIEDGEYILSGESIIFPELNCYLKLQDDGNLVLSRGTPGNRRGTIWSTSTSYESGKYFAKLQGDGNLVIHRGTPSSVGDAIYTSHSVGGHGDYFLGMDGDGRLCIFEGTLNNIKRTVWSNIKHKIEAGDLLLEGEIFKTPGVNAFLTLQGDGNLVLYKGSGKDDKQGSLWSAECKSDAKDHFLNFQKDGNMVVYTGTPLNVGTPIYSSQFRYNSYHLEITDDLHFVARAGKESYPGSIIWENGAAKKPSISYQVEFYEDDYPDQETRFFDGTNRIDNVCGYNAGSSVHDNNATLIRNVNGLYRLFGYENYAITPMIDANIPKQHVKKASVYEGIYYYVGDFGDQRPTTIESYDHGDYEVIASGNHIIDGLEHSGHNLVWAAHNGSAEIFFYNGAETIQLTDNSFDERNPKIAGNEIAWVGFDGNDTEIFYYDGNSIIQVTDNDFDDADRVYTNELSISEGLIIWTAYDGDAVFVYENGEVKELPSGDNNYSPVASFGKAVWAAWDGNDTEIYLYENGLVTQLTDNSYDDYSPVITGNYLTWINRDGLHMRLLWNDEVITIDDESIWSFNVER